jgi:hypothetical protein
MANAVLIARRRRDHLRDPRLGHAGDTTLAALVLLYGSYALVAGWLGLSGAVSIIFGAFVMVAPPETRRPSMGQRMYEREPSPRGEVPWSC